MSTDKNTFKMKLDEISTENAISTKCFSIKKARRRMTKPKFTPGPWNVKFSMCEDMTFAYIVKEPHKTIAEVFLHDDEDEQEANAALIAAAPEMYAALEEILVDLDTFPQVAPGVDHPEVFDLKLKLRKLLSKARGESEVKG